MGAEILLEGCGAPEESLTVDSLVIGDTPFALSVQDTLRDMGESTFLIYTGNLDYKYMYVEEINAPHCKLVYPFAASSRISPLMTSSYRTYLKTSLGGDYYFLYGLVAAAAASPEVTLSMSSVRTTTFKHRHSGCHGSPGVVATLNKFVTVFDASGLSPRNLTIHYNKLVVTESLRVFLGRIGLSASLPSRNLGLVLEESINLLPGEITLGGLGSSPSVPLFSISRGYLKFHFYSHSDRVNITLLDYIRTPSSEVYSIISALEQKEIYLVGPRAMWSSGLSLSSETDRLRYLYE